MRLSGRACLACTRPWVLASPLKTEGGAEEGEGGKEKGEKEGGEGERKEKRNTRRRGRRARQTVVPTDAKRKGFFIQHKRNNQGSSGHGG